MTIGLIMQGGRTWAGGAEYIKNIALALASLPADVRATFRVKVLCAQELEDDYLQSLLPVVESIHYLEKEQLPLTFVNKVKWKLKQIFSKRVNPRLDEFLQSLDVDFVYPYFDPTAQNVPVSSCPWIPDFQHKYLPHLFSKSEIQDRDRHYEAIANSSKRLVVSSETAAADFHKFFPHSTCKTEVLQFKTVLPEAYYEADAVEIQKKYNLPDRFLIVSNQFWRHKNHLMIFEALRKLSIDNVYPNVVCTGHLYDPRYPRYSDQILDAIHTQNLSKQVYLLGMIPRADQIQLLRRSMAVLQPSLFEGWSTVVEDARCLGKPALLSDFPVHVEQSPPDSRFFESLSVKSLASLLKETWMTNTSGPVRSKELAAHSESIEAVESFGRRFLIIAQMS